MFVSNDGRALIGYFSKWAGLSRSGVRLLEKRGVVEGRGNEDQDGSYRTFDTDDFLRLDLFRRYRAMGFSQAEAMDVCGQDCPETLASLQSRMAQEKERYRAAMRALEAAVRRTERAMQPQLWSLEYSPAFVCLPDPLEVAKSLSTHGAHGVDLDAIIGEDIAWSESLPIETGLIFHHPGNNSGNERVTLVELGQDALASLPEMEHALIIPPFWSLHFIARGRASEASTYVPSDLDGFAARANVSARLEGAVGRTLHMQRVSDNLLVTLEVWAPVDAARDQIV